MGHRTVRNNEVFDCTKRCDRIKTLQVEAAGNCTNSFSLILYFFNWIKSEFLIFWLILFCFCFWWCCCCCCCCCFALFRTRKMKQNRGQRKYFNGIGVLEQPWSGSITTELGRNSRGVGPSLRASSRGWLEITRAVGHALSTWRTWFLSSRVLKSCACSRAGFNLSTLFNRNS